MNKLFTFVLIGLLGLVTLAPKQTYAEVERKVKVSSNDNTSGFLNGKIVAGSNVTLVENNDGGNETLTINSSVTGTGVVLDLTDDAFNESTGILEIATTGDTNNIFTEPTPDKLLIDGTKDWPKADRADQLNANGANASAGNAILGVDEFGAAEGAFDVATQTEFDAHTTATAVHGATGAVVGTTNTQTLTNKTVATSSNSVTATASRCARFDGSGNLTAASGDCTAGDTGGSGDAVSVNGSAATDANFIDGDIDFTLNTVPSPDEVSATVGCVDCVALTTETSGNYVANASTSILTGLTGGSAGSEGTSLALAFDYSQALSGDFGLAANATVFGQAGLIAEGATANTFEGFLAFADVTADRTWTLPDRSGTVSLSGDTFTGDVTGTLSSSGATALTIASNSVALTTDTTGNYVASLTNGTGISGADGGSEGAALTLSVVADSTTQRVEVAKNSAATTGTRKRINFIEGSNVILTVADDSGNNEVDVTIASSGSGGYSTIQDEASNLTQRSTLNFAGAGVSCADDAGTKTTCTIPGSGAATITVEEDNTTVSTVVTDIDFGSGFDVTESPVGEANIVMDLSENVTGDVLFNTSNVATIQANSVALSTDTTGNYVLDVSDGIGIDGTAAAEGATYTPALDHTEINDTTWGDNTDATITHIFNPTGSTNPVWSYTDGVANLSTGTLQYGGNIVGTSSNNLSFFTATTSAQLLGVLSDETGSGLAVFGTSPTITTPTISGAISFPDGVRQTFNPDGTTPGLNFGSQAGDPSTPSNGDVWYNSTSNKFRCRENGANTDCIGSAGGAGGWTDNGATVNLTTSSDKVGIGTTGGTYKLQVEDSDTPLGIQKNVTTNGTSNLWQADIVNSSGVGGTGLGSAMQFGIENSSSTVLTAANFTIEYTDGTAGSEDVKWSFKHYINGSLIVPMVLDQTGLALGSNTTATDYAARFVVKGTSDIIQTRIVGHSTQTADTFQIRSDAGSTLLSFNEVQKLVVPGQSTQTIAGGDTITANSCSSMKKISSAGAVTTSTANTFTAPATENSGCIMYVCNVGANTINLDNNANFKSNSGLDVTLTADDCVTVSSSGSGGTWYQIAPVSVN